MMGTGNRLVTLVSVRGRHAKLSSLGRGGRGGARACSGSQEGGEGERKQHQMEGIRKEKINSKN